MKKNIKSILKTLAYILIGIIVFIPFAMFVSPYTIWLFDGNVIVAIIVLLVFIIIVGALHSYFTNWNKKVIIYWFLFLVLNTFITIHEFGNRLVKSSGDYLVIECPDIEGYALFTKYGELLGYGNAVFLFNRENLDYKIVLVRILKDKDEVEFIHIWDNDIYHEKTYRIVDKNENRPKKTVYEFLMENKYDYKYYLSGAEKTKSIFIDYTKDLYDIESEESITTTEDINTDEVVEDDYYESHDDNENDDIPEGLLYKGIYTISGQGQFMSSGEYTIAIPDMEVQISVYEDYLDFLGDKMEYTGMQNGNRIYAGVIGGFRNRFVVSPSYEMYKMNEVTGPLGNDWVRVEMSKGENLMPKHSIGNNRYNSNDYNTRHYDNSYEQPKSKAGKIACRSCMYTNGRCPVCKGERQIIKTAYGHEVVATCDNCKGTGRCPICGGDGWIIKP